MYIIHKSKNWFRWSCIRIVQHTAMSSKHSTHTQTLCQAEAQKSTFILIDFDRHKYLQNTFFILCKNVFGSMKLFNFITYMRKVSIFRKVSTIWSILNFDVLDCELTFFITTLHIYSIHKGQCHLYIEL